MTPLPPGPPKKGLDNAPYLTRVGEPRRDLIQISKEPILTNDECAAIIDSAEK